MFLGIKKIQQSQSFLIKPKVIYHKNLINIILSTYIYRKMQRLS